jgi:AraC-like DNA-binding protein
MGNIIHLKSISDLHRFLALGHARHPLIAVIDLCKLKDEYEGEIRIRTDFYSVMFKNYCRNHIRYGRKSLDFTEGNLVCIGPNQVISMDAETQEHDDMLGWGLFFHPDLIRGTSLGTSIRTFSFFSYEVTEALHLSEKEKKNLHDCVLNIDRELRENIDDFSQRIIVSNLDLVLSHIQRYYGRQFITRKITHRDVLGRIESILYDYIHQGDPEKHGLPTVKYLAEKVHLSPNYLSDLLKKETGLSAQEHIHQIIIEEAKSLLKQSDRSVSEVSDALGFEYPQYFGRLFKRMTGFTPGHYRNNN